MSGCHSGTGGKSVSFLGFSPPKSPEKIPMVRNKVTKERFILSAKARTMELTRAAPLAFSMEHQRHRGVECSDFVRPLIVIGRWPHIFHHLFLRGALRGPLICLVVHQLTSWALVRQLLPKVWQAS